jgi:hypothetical protein
MNTKYISVRIYPRSWLYDYLEAEKVRGVPYATAINALAPPGDAFTLDDIRWAVRDEVNAALADRHYNRKTPGATETPTNQPQKRQGETQ